MSTIEFTTDQKLAILLAGIGIFFGWLFTYVYFRKAQHVRGLCYGHNQERFISYWYKKTDGFRITFDGDEVYDPASSKVYMWNYGNDTIDRTDISVKETLKYGSDQIRILTASVNTQSRPSINSSVSLSIDKQFALIDFDFLDNGDGIVIDLTYDIVDKNATRPLLSLLGSIKGQKGGPRRVSLNFTRTKSVANICVGILLLTFSVSIILMLVYDIYSSGLWSVVSLAKIVATTVLTLIAILSSAFWLSSFEDDKFLVPDNLMPVNDADFLSQSEHYTSHELVRAQSISATNVLATHRKSDT